MRNFKELEIWKEGMMVTPEIYKITKVMPVEEEYGLKRQLRRAAVSIRRISLKAVVGPVSETTSISWKFLSGPHSNRKLN